MWINCVWDERSWSRSRSRSRPKVARLRISGRNINLTLGDWYQNTKTNYRYCYGYQSLKISRWSVIRCSYDEHSNFLWGELTWRDLTLSDLGLKFLQYMRTRYMNRFAKNGGAEVPPFMIYLRKTWGECSNPTPGPERVILFCCCW